MTTESSLDLLDVHNGSILILRGPGDTEAMHRVAQDVRRALYSHNLDDVTILVLAPNTELSTLDDAGMAEAGWVRAERVTVVATHSLRE